MTKPKNADKNQLCLFVIKQLFQSIKSLKTKLTVALISIMLSACGGGKDNIEPGETPTPVDASQPSPDPLPDPSPNNGQYTVIDFDFAQLVQNRQYRIKDVQTQQFTNATGQFKLPLANQNLSGNLTIAIDAQDSEGIETITVGFAGSEQAMQVCNNNCTNPYYQVLTGINPLDFGVQDGPNRLYMSIKDTQGNQVTVINVDFNWQRTIINGLNAERSAGNINLNWQGLNNYLRYNLYIANQSGIAADNYQTLDGGQAFLAIENVSYNLTDINDSQVLFATVTGVDGSGESAFSEQIKIPALAGINDELPIANNDEFVLHEDSSFSGNFLTNDTDDNSPNLVADTTAIMEPTNGTVTINSDGSFTYTPITDFHGSDQFQYQVRDNLLQSAIGTVSLTINPVNDSSPAVNR